MHSNGLSIGISVLPAESSTAHISGDFVVFIIGVAVHNWLDVRGWWPVVTGFSKMMKELQVCLAHPQYNMAKPCLSWHK